MVIDWILLVFDGIQCWLFMLDVGCWGLLMMVSNAVLSVEVFVTDGVWWFYVIVF